MHICHGRLIYGFLCFPIKLLSVFVLVTQLLEPSKMETWGQGLKRRSSLLPLITEECVKAEDIKCRLAKVSLPGGCR